MYLPVHRFKKYNEVFYLSRSQAQTVKNIDLMKQQTALRWQGTVLSNYNSIDPSLSCIVSNYNIICLSVMDLSQILLSCLHALLHSLSLSAHISPVMIRNHCQISRIWQQPLRTLPIVGSLVGQRGKLWIIITHIVLMSLWRYKSLHHTGLLLMCVLQCKIKQQ